MKAALCKSLDGPDAIEIADLPAPIPGPGEVTVRVRAAALNFLDTLITRGKYQYKPAPPFSPAAEIAGEIIALGPGVSVWKPGDRIAAYIGWGGAREEVAVKAAALIPVPDGVDDVAAAGINVTYGTAMHALRDRGRLTPGETVAVLGASGGAGLAAVEIAAAMGARVIACASSPEKLAVCQAHGATAAIDYTTEDLKQRLRDLTGGAGADVIYDCVGGPYAEPALRSIAWQGRFLVIGFAAGDIPKIPANLLLLKGCDAAGVFWGEFTTRHPERHAANMAELLAWIRDGRVKPHTSHAFPLADTADAIRVLDRREATGKVVVTM
jgi:NADPH2:quinone reductase